MSEFLYGAAAGILAAAIFTALCDSIIEQLEEIAAELKKLARSLE